MNPQWMDELTTLIASVKNGAEARELLTTLLTPAECDDLAKRWQIVKQLIDGVPQRAIRDSLAVSIATVTRGSREIRYGSGVLQKFYQRIHRERR